MFIFLLILLLISTILEGSVTTLPLVLMCLLCLAIFKRDAVIFPFAFAAGLFLDIFTLRSVGGTSIFFLIFVFLIFLYQRKYEINSYQFVLVAGCLGSALYLKIFGFQEVWMQAVISALLASVLFGIVRLIANSQVKSKDTKFQIRTPK